MQKISMFGREVSIKDDLKEIVLKDVERLLVDFSLVEKGPDIEELIEFAGVISDITEEEKDIITKDELITIIGYISKFKADDNNFINLFEIDGEKYITTASDGKFSFSAMEIGALQKAFNEGKDMSNFYSKIAATVFRKQNESGKPSTLRNESIEDFQKRVDLFREKMTINYVNSYVQEYQKNILKEYDKSNTNS